MVWGGLGYIPRSKKSFQCVKTNGFLILSMKNTNPLKFMNVKIIDMETKDELNP